MTGSRGAVWPASRPTHAAPHRNPRHRPLHRGNDHGWNQCDDPRLSRPAQTPRPRSGPSLARRGDDRPGGQRETDLAVGPEQADRRRAVARAGDRRVEVPKVRTGPHRSRPSPPRRRPDLHRPPQLRRPECPRREPCPGAGARIHGVGSDCDVSPRPCRIPSQGTRIPSRQQEAHMFRKMNYLKCLACRIRDRIDPDSPDLGGPGRDRTTANRGPEAEEPDRRDPPAAGQSRSPRSMSGPATTYRNGSATAPSP